MAQRSPLPRAAAWAAVGRCVLTSIAMLVRRDVHLPKPNVGRRISFANGTTGRVYRETTVPRTPVEPCVLVVSFRLRAVRGRRGHALFRAESILNMPLFVGFPGFVSKLWLAHDANGIYRGVYEWDGPGQAEHYARSLWRVLALVSEADSIDFRVLPGLHRDDVLADPAQVPSQSLEEASAWWRVVEAA
ncbi:hypothetical protein [Mumia sp. DW29H23]|uniref:hypothetical protein n=1 Tax=Mumia sp. DW29H23 TaxID=3421241 RepID=UPI003D68C0A7